MRKKSLKRNARKFLLLLQHVLIVTAAVCILAVLTGSGIMLTGVEENYSYSMDAGENEGLYEDSLLFNHIFGRGSCGCGQDGSNTFPDGNRRAF